MLILSNLINYSSNNKNNYINIIPKENIFVFNKFKKINLLLFIKISYNSGDIKLFNILFLINFKNYSSLFSIILIKDHLF